MSWVGKISCGKVVLHPMGALERDLSLAGRWVKDCDRRHVRGGLVDSEDAISLIGSGDGARGIFSEETVTVAGDEAVGGFAEEAGDGVEDTGEDGEGTVDQAESVIDGVGAAEEALVGGESGGDEDDTLLRTCRGEVG